MVNLRLDDRLLYWLERFLIKPTCCSCCRKPEVAKMFQHTFMFPFQAQVMWWVCYSLMSHIEVVGGLVDLKNVV
jgi:hypothetical protein